MMLTIDSIACSSNFSDASAWMRLLASEVDNAKASDRFENDDDDDDNRDDIVPTR